MEHSRCQEEKPDRCAFWINIFVLKLLISTQSMVFAHPSTAMKCSRTLKFRVHDLAEINISSLTVKHCNTICRPVKYDKVMFIVTLPKCDAHQHISVQESEIATTSSGIKSENTFL
ncbi:MAG: hypothetical protein ACRC41_09440 [Sarcina sp.]